MSGADLLARRELDLQDELDDLRAQIDDYEAKIDERVERALELEAADDDAETAEEFEQIEDEVDVLESLLPPMRGYADAIEAAIDEWEGTTFEVRELSAADARQIRDELQREVNARGWESYPEGMHEVRALQKQIVRTPPGAPDVEDIGTLPNRLFEWLKNRADAMNVVGGFDLGNSSLRRRMMARRGSS